MRWNENDARRTRGAQSGNAFYLVLLGVFLFAALMFTFSKSAKQGTSNLTRRQAQLAADDILTFAQQMQHAVDRVYSRGCSESEISFDQDTLTGYANAGAPADFHCHIFRPAGGAATYRAAPVNANTGGDWIFTGANAIAGADFGTAAPDLVMILPDVAGSVCTEINRLLKIAGATAEAGAPSSTPFTGAFTASGQIGSGDGLRAECTTETGHNRFYSVLLER